MRIVETLVVGDDADVVTEHLAYHLNAGIDLVLAADLGSHDGTREILQSFAGEGVLQLVESNSRLDGDPHRELVRQAATEHGADWVISAEADEFWMPRGESLKDVLAVIPARYTVVQALARIFLPRADDERSFVERMTARRSFYGAREDGLDSPSKALRPVLRIDERNIDDPLDVDRQVPLRAWYPIEVLRFPLRSAAQVERQVAADAVRRIAPRSAIEAEALRAHDRGDIAGWYAEVTADHAARIGEQGSVVEDTRLLDALQLVRRPDGASRRRFMLPSEGARMALNVPDIVDDAAYAGECAAVREVDYEKLERYITELEQRLAVLERRLWPRVVGRLTRAVRR